MTKIKAVAGYSATTYPAAAWCDAKNSPAITGISWYLPAVREMEALRDVRDPINTALTAASCQVLFGSERVNTYWTSTELSADNAQLVDRSVSPQNEKDYDLFGVRAISAFSKN